MNVGARVTSIIAIVVGAALVLWTVGSAIKTVILPRAAASSITRAVFLVMRRIYLLFAPSSTSYERRDRVLATYAPMSLVATLVTWLTLVLLGYGLIFWGDEHRSWAHAFELSGSSLFTLGIVRPGSTVATIIVFSEAAIGLFLLALLITYLPSIYSTFSRRELGVTALEVRAGAPPSGREMMWRYWALERFDELSEVWIEWERWFVDIEETHTSLPALVFFRSPQPDHSWVTAGGAVLDGAALAVSTIDVPRDVRAEFCIRAGYLAFRRIAAFFQIPFDPVPEPDDPISVSRQEWDEAVAFLEAEGVPIKPDRDRAWRDFAGWRVNYDTVLLALCDITSAPPAPWSSDRVTNRSFRPKMFSSGVR